MDMKSEKLLTSFIAYCKENPEQRFWQALRNWSGYAFIYGSDMTPPNIHPNPNLDKEANNELFIDQLTDTFYIK